MFTFLLFGFRRTMSNGKQLFVFSSQRISGSPTDFVVAFDPIPNVVALEILDVDIPYLFYNVRSDCNAFFCSGVMCYVPVGCYTASELATAMYDAQTGPGHVEFKYHAIIDRYSLIAASGTVGTIDVNFFVDNSIGKVLGFASRNFTIAGEGSVDAVTRRYALNEPQLRRRSVSIDIDGCATVMGTAQIPSTAASFGRLQNAANRGESLTLNVRDGAMIAPSSKSTFWNLRIRFFDLEENTFLGSDVYNTEWSFVLFFHTSQ